VHVLLAGVTMLASVSEPFSFDNPTASAAAAATAMAASHAL